MSGWDVWNMTVDYMFAIYGGEARDCPKSLEECRIVQSHGYVPLCLLRTFLYTHPTERILHQPPIIRKNGTAFRLPGW